MWNIMRFELISCFKKASYLIYIYVFYIGSLFLGGLLGQGSGREGGAEGVILSSDLWLIMLFSVLSYAGLLWQEDRKSGFLDQWRISGQSIEKLVLSKFVCGMLMLILPLGVLGGGYHLLTHPAVAAASSALEVLFILLISGSQVLVTAMLTSALGSGGRQGSGAFSVSIIPMIIPTLVAAHTALGNSISEPTAGQQDNALILLIGYSGLTIPAMLLVIAALLRARD